MTTTEEKGMEKVGGWIYIEVRCIPRSISSLPVIMENECEIFHQVTRGSVPLQQR